MKVKNYEVIIDTKNAQCGVVINKNEYDLSHLKNENLIYSVDFQNKLVLIEPENKLIKPIVLLNADREFLYYCVKSLQISIMVGTNFPLNVEFTVSANLKE